MCCWAFKVLLTLLLNIAFSHPEGPLEDIPIPMLGVPAFLNAGLLQRFIDSIDYPVEKVVIVHNGQHMGVAKVVEDIRSRHPNYIILRHPENLGCAGSWNAIINVNPHSPYYIIANDDVAFLPGALRIFVAGIQRQIEQVNQGASNRVLLFPHFARWPMDTGIWSCFALLQQAVTAVGKFDENIWPVYHEDRDYDARLSRAGLWHMQIPGAFLLHGPPKARWMSGSDRAVYFQKKDPQVRLYSQQQSRHRKGAPYFALKWGVAWISGILDLKWGHWNQTCSHTNHTPPVCSPATPLHYAHPFNDPSLPLSVSIFDSAYRKCLVRGNSRCMYNRHLLPHPELLPDGEFHDPPGVWKRHNATPLSLAPGPAGGLPRPSARAATPSTSQRAWSFASGQPIPR
eukprot:GGOE01041380.1.p1 GENE.GGOE01041380.1~~GGOE01041380.1.p1  ORF type:complete len:399 (-),score=67.30 GGOE01041380.1:463-1659(-)